MSSPRLSGVKRPRDDDEPEPVPSGTIDRIPVVPWALPGVGNALSVAMDGMVPEKTLGRWHAAYGDRYICALPGIGQVLITKAASDVPRISRPGYLTKRDDVPFPWKDTFEAAGDSRELTLTWLTDKDYTNGIGMFKNMLYDPKVAVDRFGNHIMFNVNRMMRRFEQKRGSGVAPATCPKQKALFFGFLCDPSIQLTTGKDLRFTEIDRDDLPDDEGFFYDSVLNLGSNQLAVSQNPLGKMTEGYQTCFKYWDSLYGMCGQWINELKAARDLNGGVWPQAVSKDKAIFLDAYDDFFMKGLCDEGRLVANAVEFIIGTADPGAQLIENILFQLATRPVEQQKVYEELVRVFGATGEIATLNFAQWDKLKYLQAFIWETCRHHPLFVLHQRRIIKPTVLADGTEIEPGNLVAVNYYAMCHDEANYDNPDVFNVERFLNLPPLPPMSERGDTRTGKCPFAPGKIKNIEAACPFGMGQRMCAGFGWAVAIVGMACASIVRKYKMTWMGPKEEDIKLEGMFPNHSIKPIDDFFFYEKRVPAS